MEVEVNSKRGSPGHDVSDLVTLPGWSCLGSIRSVGGIYLEKGETNPECDGSLAGGRARTDPSPLDVHQEGIKQG